MFQNRDRHLVAAFVSLCLHLLVVTVAGKHLLGSLQRPPAPKAAIQIIFVEAAPPPAPKDPSEPAPLPPVPVPVAPAIEPPTIDDKPTPPAADRVPATMAAPAAPTAEEWAFAAGYTLKNSKGYRHNWGKQVRSMMGTAVEGPDQGMVRFLVEIAPDGSLARLETLWSTSPVAERLARKAIEEMPPLPPTPTGKPLIFERTISFSPFAADDSPIYRDDCLPDPPAFRNPFAWDGKSPPTRAAPKLAEKPDPQALEDCRKQLPRDSIEAESAHDQRLLDQGRSNKLDR